MSVPAAFSLRLRGTSQCPLIARHLFYHSAPCCLHMASVGIFRPCVYYHVTLMLKLLQFLCLVNLMVKFEFPVVAYNKERGAGLCMLFHFQLLPLLLTYAHPLVIHITFGFLNLPGWTSQTGSVALPRNPVVFTKVHCNSFQMCLFL